MTLVDLTDPRLFGNDAAEDEAEDVFLAHALERAELARFKNPDEKICVARAYKGEGKSALLRFARYKLIRAGAPPLVIATTAAAIAPALATSDFHQWVRHWKAAIVGRFAAEIGAQIGFAWSDDSMSLVEEAEKAGFRSRSLVGAVLHRFKPSVAIGPAEISAAERDPGTANPEAAVRRWAEGQQPIWLFLDDIDQNFENTAEFRAKVAACFVATRELARAIPELRVRLAIRPNVWTTLKLNFEALSHVEQYVIDLSWSEYQMRDLLAKRIEGYLRLSGRWAGASREIPGFERERALIRLAFQDPMSWGRSTRPPHVLLHTLSKHRPRWMVELSKVAARKAVQENQQKITRDDLFSELGAFGERRIADTIAEFSSQCPEIGELIAAFRQEAEQFTTDELFRLITNKILNHLNPHISGVIGTPGVRQVAAFMFQVGFFYGREEEEDGGYRHIAYSDRPHLFVSRTSVDDGLTWEVHPVFRQALEMRDPEGHEVRRPRLRT